jgi:hypothetical protein
MEDVGARMRFMEQCRRFECGEWQREMPQREGTYPTATRDGLHATPIAVVEMRSGEFRSVDELHYKAQWQGYWWSEPLPVLPRPAKWEE